jgi:predicted nuclease of predicted toxin-antitoxin system
MKILADDTIPMRAVDRLRALEHDVLWVPADCPSLTAESLIERAEAGSRLVLTLDQDLWLLGLQWPGGLHHAGILLVRVYPDAPRTLETLIESALSEEFDWAGRASILS